MESKLVKCDNWRKSGGIEVIMLKGKDTWLNGLEGKKDRKACSNFLNKVGVYFPILRNRATETQTTLMTQLQHE